MPSFASLLERATRAIRARHSVLTCLASVLMVCTVLLAFESHASVTQAATSPVTLKAPQKLSVVASASGVVLHWKDTSTAESGFQVQRKTGKNGIWSIIGTTSANATGYTDTQLIAKTKYFYRVRAFNGTKYGAFSDSVNVTPTVVPTPTPTATKTPTPKPTATKTPTPKPTATKTSIPTATPTKTPIPTSTPIPTATPTPNPADVRVVNTLADHDDGACSLSDASTSGDCTLREALHYVPAGGTVTFANNLVGTIALTQGELPIEKDVTITGPGAKILSVSGNKQSRVFDITGGIVSISGLTTTGGLNRVYHDGDMTTLSQYGGGLYNSGTLMLRNCTFSGNLAGELGGDDTGYGGAISNSGTVTALDCTFSGNQALNYKDGYGGAIHNAGTMSLGSCSFTGNSTEYDGGAICNTRVLTLDDCTFSGNSAPYGGGIYNNATLLIRRSTLSGNNAGYNGGGFYNAGTVSVRDSTFSGNTATVGGAIDNVSTMSLLNCTLSGNVASGRTDLVSNHGGACNDLSTCHPRFSPGRGGAIYNGGTASATNCTLSGNTVTGTLNGVYSSTDHRTGGAIFHASGSLSLMNCTLSGNADTSSGTDEAGGIGTLVSLGTFSSYNSVFVDRSSTPFSGFTAPTSSGDANQNFSFADATSAGLGALSDNGGPVLTMPLLSGSPLLDAGGSSGTPTFDARGALRPQGGGVDVGAYESGPLLAHFFALSGSVQLQTTGQGVAGVIITVTDAGGNAVGTTLSDAGGHWTLSDLLSGTYTATPSRTGYMFLPTSRTGVMTNADDMLGAFTTTAPIESLVVTTLADEDNGTSDVDFGTGTSLREAINYAAKKSGADTITFKSGLTGTITLPDISLVLGQDLTITGPGTNVLTVSNDADARVFDITSGTCRISGLTISGGGIGSRAIYWGISNVTVSNCALVGNTFGSGGGISTGTGSTMTVSNCTFSGNSATGNSDAVGGGGIYNYMGTVTVSNCTFSGNSTVAHGGAIYNYSGSMTVNNSTFAGNSAPSGNDIYNAGGMTMISNTLLNDMGSLASLGNGFHDGGYNLARDNGGGFLTAGTDKLNTLPKLGSLANNGGPTKTYALLAGSPAINAGDPNFDPNSLTTDQRGTGYPRVNGGRLDIGAFESSGA